MTGSVKAGMARWRDGASHSAEIFHVVEGTPASVKLYCALPGLRVGFGGGAVADSDRMTCIDEVDGHALAHLAQADESDVHGFHHAAVSSALPAAQ